jgi:hypothetical protein
LRARCRSGACPRLFSRYDGSASRPRRGRTVVDLCFLSRPRLDDARGLGREAVAHAPHKPAHARITALEAVLVDQVLPYRHRVSAAADRGGSRRIAAARRARYGTHTFSVCDGPIGGRRATAAVVAGLGVGRCAGRPPHPRIATSAVLRWPLTVSRRTPVMLSMRRSDQPSRPNAITCCCLVSSKTLLMAINPHRGPTAVNASAHPSWWPVFRCPRVAGFGCPPRS